MKALQRFSDEALERGRKMRTDEVLRFLEEFRVMYAAKAAPSKEVADESPRQGKPELE